MRNNTRVLYILLLTSTLSFSSVGNGPTDKDTAEIIGLTLQRAIVEGQIPDYQLMKDKQNFVLSSENINIKFLPRIPGVNLLVLSKQQIQEAADRDELFFFIRFRSIQIYGNKAEVILDNIHAVGRRTKVMGFGGSFTITYQKINGSWEGKVTSYTVP